MKILKRLKYFVFHVLLYTLISTRVSYHLDIRPLEILTLTASRVLKRIDVLMHHIHLYASLIKKKELLFRQLDNWNLFYSRYSTEVLICAKGFYRFASGTVNLSPWSVSSDTKLILNVMNIMDPGMGNFFFRRWVAVLIKMNIMKSNVLNSKKIIYCDLVWITWVMNCQIAFNYHIYKYSLQSMNDKKNSAVFIYSRISHNIKRFYWNLLENI